jgi:hypothetical protein
MKHKFWEIIAGNLSKTGWSLGQYGYFAPNGQSAAQTELLARDIAAFFAGL